MKLNDLRQQIDHIDSQLVDLFLKRMALCKEIAYAKIECGQAINVPGRETEVLKKVLAQTTPEMREYVRLLYQKLFELSKDYQTKMIDSEVE